MSVQRKNGKERKGKSARERRGVKGSDGGDEHSGCFFPFTSGMKNWRRKKKHGINRFSIVATRARERSETGGREERNGTDLRIPQRRPETVCPTRTLLVRVSRDLGLAHDLVSVFSSATPLVSWEVRSLLLFLLVLEVVTEVVLVLVLVVVGGGGRVVDVLGLAVGVSGDVVAVKRE